jgi:peptide/nickel transport system substrate-binding protein
MKFRVKTAGVAIAVASLTGLAACSTSSSPTTTVTKPGTVTVPGGLGSVPLASSSGPKKAGTITWAMQPGATPNWIFPIVPSASNSVFNNFTFIWEMWRPLVWTVYGVDPEPYWPMSLINPPVYTNGDKTLTVTLKSTYKWSNGQPITANDIVFFIDLVRAADKESSADWAGYVPGHFPDNLVSTSEPNSTTLVMNFSSAVNPTWFTDNYLGQGPIIPLPSAVWAKPSASGAIIPPSGWTPAAMTKIYNYLISQAKSLSTYATNPLWQVVDGPYKLTAYNTTTGGFTMVKNEASFLTSNQPVQFQPVPDYIWAWTNKLSSTLPQMWENLTQYYATPEFWYFN